MVARDGGANAGDFLGGVVQLSGSCALKADGTVWCWGYGYYGQLGNDASVNKDHPVQVVARDGGASAGEFLGGVVQLEAGGGHTCALKADGSVWCWGGGAQGQLGNDASSNKDHPVQVVARDGASAGEFLGGVVQLEAGGAHTCALKADGSLWCWGYGYDGQLGNDASGNSNNKDHPVRVVDGDGSSGVFGMGSYQRSYTCLGNEVGVNCSLNTVQLALAAGDVSPSKNVTNPGIKIFGIGTGQSVSLYSNEGCTEQVGSAVLSPSGTRSTSGLSEGEHKFYFTVTEVSTSTTRSCSKSFLAYVLDMTAPGTPLIAMATSSPGTDTTPDVTVSNLTAGDMVRVYSDSSCGTEAAGAVLAQGATSVTITVSELSGTGEHTFYAKAFDLAGNGSPCSESPATYTLQ